MNIEEIATKKDLEEMEKRIIAALSSRQRNEETLDIDSACAYIKAKKSQMYKLTSSGEIAFCKIGKSNVFKVSDLDRYLARKRRASNAEISSKTYIRMKSNQHNYDPFNENF